MPFTVDTRVSDIATTEPATIKVFQQHQIDFCCGGKIPLGEACALQGLDPEVLLDQLRAAQRGPGESPDWDTSPLTALIAHIQQRYHQPLRSELQRLGEMLAKVVLRHGEDRADTLLPLQATFLTLRSELVEHMAKEDAVLFPAIRAAEDALLRADDRAQSWRWIEQPIGGMEADHELAGRALATMRELTSGYTPPEGACPTFRGLYHGLAEFEADMHVHVHLENNVLFPRAVALSRALAANPSGRGDTL
jgi:regulator of cell morphogenesis and NO signaling